MNPPDHSPFQLHIDLGQSFLLTVLDRYGVEGWNRWLQALAVGNFFPQVWGKDEPIPAVLFGLCFGGADLSGRKLDGIKFGMAWHPHTRFDSASLVCAELGCCRNSSFCMADLRQANFEDGDITGCDFCGAILDSIRLDGATYDHEDPPIGLPPELLKICRQDLAESESVGWDTFPVIVESCLTEFSYD
jgi:hypothetical protein